MKIDILTLFPEMFDALNHSILARAQKNNLIEIKVTNIRDFSKDNNKRCDDYSYGGGAGMIMTPQPLFDAINFVKEQNKEQKIEQNEKQKKEQDNSQISKDNNLNNLQDSEQKSENKENYVIYMSPKGKVLTQKKVENIAKNFSNIIIVCGHYEGIDERIIELCIDEEISIGDYVLTGGELPAMVLIDAVARHLPNVLGNSQTTDVESFTDNLLEYPQYTRPATFEGLSVPEVLLNGNHGEIAKWRKEQSIKITKARRPDLLKDN